MEIKFLQKMSNPNGTDGVRLSYILNNRKIFLEVSGTAMAVYNIGNLSDYELGMIFIPVITDIYIKLKEQGAQLEEISMHSEGAQINGKIVYSKEEIEESLKQRTRCLVNGEFWEILYSGGGDSKPFRVVNTHQTAYEKSGSHQPDFIDSFATKQEAVNFLNKQ